MMCKELLFISLVVLLGNNIKADKPSIKKVLKIVKEIRKNMVTVDEIVDALAPLINSCGGPSGLEGIFVAGGITSQEYRTEAFYNPVTNFLCNIPPMYYQRESSTTTGFTACGGIDIFTDDIVYNCETFNPNTGVWYVSHYFNDTRVNHVAWQSSVGLYLMSGWGGPLNSTLLGNDGSVGPGFELLYSASYGCAVPDPATDSVIVIGGEALSTNVTRYNDYGFKESLPQLNAGRVYLGCSGFYNEAGNLVLVVTGGASSYYPTPTETLEVGVELTWNSYDDNNAEDISCANPNNAVYCLQGYNGYNVTKWNPDYDQFDLMLDTSYWRGYWGNFASAVPINSGVEDWCMSYEKEKKLEKNIAPPERKDLDLASKNDKEEKN